MSNQDKKRYIVFAYNMYYPHGARDDEEGRYNTLDECFVFIEQARDDWEEFDILDLETGEWIDEKGWEKE